MTRRALLLVAVVLALAGCGSDPAATPTTCATTTPTGGLFIEATDDLAFVPAAVTADAGDVSLTLSNTGSLPHSLVIDGQPLKLTVGDNPTCSGTIDLRPGEHVFFCDVPGHREAGMEGVLTVE